MPKFREIEKKKQKKISRQALLTIIIALIMITSVFGIIFFNDNQQSYESKYNNIKFTRTQDNFWVADINKQRMQFDFHPSEIDYIAVDNKTLSAIENAGMVYLTYSPDQPFVQDIALAEFGLQNALASRNIYVVNALTNVSAFSLPKITCDNATSSIPVIYFKVSNETQARTESNCIILEGESGRDFLALKDRLIYGLLKVIK